MGMSALRHCRRRKARTVFSDPQLTGLEKRFEAQRYVVLPEVLKPAHYFFIKVSLDPGTSGTCNGFGPVRDSSENMVPGMPDGKSSSKHSSSNFYSPRIGEWSTRSSFDEKTPWQPPVASKVLNWIVPRSLGRKAPLRKFGNLIKFSFSSTTFPRCSRQLQPATIEPVGEIFVHRLQSQQQQRVSIKVKFKLHSAKLLVEFRFNEEFQQREWKRLDEWELRRRKRGGHCRGWDALLSLTRN